MCFFTQTWSLQAVLCDSFKLAVWKNNKKIYVYILFCGDISYNSDSLNLTKSKVTLLEGPKQQNIVRDIMYDLSEGHNTLRPCVNIYIFFIFFPKRPT